MPTAVSILLVLALVLLVTGVAVVARRRTKDPATVVTSQSHQRFRDVRQVDNTGN